MHIENLYENKTSGEFVIETQELFIQVNPAENTIIISDKNTSQFKHELDGTFDLVPLQNSERVDKLKGIYHKMRTEAIVNLIWEW